MSGAGAGRRGCRRGWEYARNVDAASAVRRCGNKRKSVRHCEVRSYDITVVLSSDRMMRVRAVPCHLSFVYVQQLTEQNTPMRRHLNLEETRILGRRSPTAVRKSRSIFQTKTIVDVRAPSSRLSLKTQSCSPICRHLLYYS